MNRHIRKKTKKTNNPRIGVSSMRARRPQPDDLTIGDDCPNATRADLLAKCAPSANETALALDARKEQMLAAFTRHAKVRAAGFAGVDSKGTLVDRRDNPSAIPVLRNPALHVPHPTRCGCGSLRLVWRDGRHTETLCLACGATAPTPDPDAP